MCVCAHACVCGVCGVYMCVWCVRVCGVWCVCVCVWCVRVCGVWCVCVCVWCVRVCVCVCVWCVRVCVCVVCGCVVWCITCADLETSICLHCLRHMYILSTSHVHIVYVTCTYCHNLPKLAHGIHLHVHVYRM